MDDTMPADGRCSSNEYLEGHNELQVCVDKGGDDWESSFFEQLSVEDQEQDGDGEDEMDVESLLTKVMSFKEAMLALEDVNQFWKIEDISGRVGSAIDELAGLKAVSTIEADHHS